MDNSTESPVDSSLKFVKRSDLVVPINKLLCTKGTSNKCEICGKPATLMSVEYPAFYCSYEHFDIDWRGIKSLLVQDLVILNEKPALIGSEEDRDSRQNEIKLIKKELLDLCAETAQKFLVQGKYQLAVPAALQDLKFAIDVYGSDSLELVSSYLLLAEANLGLRRLKVAEEFLSLANWNILKQQKRDAESNATSNDDAPASNVVQLISHLQRNFGRLYAAQQRYNESINAFAVDVYYSCLQHGPDSIRTAPSYFHMGRVFQSLSDKKKERAEKFYEKVIQVCKNYLDNDNTSRIEHDAISQVEIEEAIEIVRHIESYRIKNQGEEAIEVKDAQKCLSLLLQTVSGT